MLIASRIAAFVAACVGVAALVIIGCMPALAQQEASPQQIRQHLSDAREALEQEDYVAAEMVLQDARTALEGAAGEAAPPKRDQLRVLIEAALEALHNEDYATALQTLQEAERIADEQQATATVEPPTRGLGNLGEIKASRLFAGPEQFPPEDFAAYGIVAFRARATAGEHERHVMLCAAYIAALPRSDELDLPVEQQMVTVWPISDTETAKELNKQTADELNEPTADERNKQTADERNEPTADERNKSRWPVACKKAISRYGLAISLQALRDAGEGRIRRDRRGPFLLAWAPTSDKGKKDALILVADLSNVTTASQAEAIFVHWRNDIEANPDLWGRGWAVDRLRLSIQHWVDRYGSQIFSILGG